MKPGSRMFWQHLFFPPIGGRVRTTRRSLREKWIPLGAWFYYCLYAWPTRRLAALVLLALLPMAGIYMVGLDMAVQKIAFGLSGAIAAAIALGWLLRPRITMETAYPPRVEVGQPFKIRYNLRNIGKRTMFDISAGTIRHPSLFDLQLHSATVPALAPGECLTAEGWGKATIRGCYRLPPLRYDSDFPSGLWRWGRTDWQERRLAVYPAYARLTSLEMPQGAGNRQDVESARQITRSALEFHGCREYRPGDSLKHIHARSSARRGIPVIREFQAEGHGRTAVLVDTWQNPPPYKLWFLPDHLTEAAIALAASVSEFLARSDRTLELLVAGPVIHRFVSAGKGGFFEDVLDILAAAETTANDTLQQLVPTVMSEIRQIACACLILCRWDKTRADLVKELAAHGIGVKTILVTPSRKAITGAPADICCVSCNAIRRGEVQAL